MRQQRNARHDPEAAHFLGGQQRQFGNLLRRRIVVDVGVAEKQRTAADDQHVHRAACAHAVAQPYDLAHVTEMLGESAGCTAEHGIDLTAPQQHGRDQGGTIAHGFLREVLRDAAAPYETVVVPPGILVAGIGLEIHHFAVGCPI